MKRPTDLATLAPSLVPTSLLKMYCLVRTWRLAAGPALEGYRPAAAHPGGRGSRCRPCPPPRRVGRGEWIVRIDPPRSFEPLGNEMVAGVYVDLSQPPGAGVDELVRHAGRHHNDLAARR